MSIYKNDLDETVRFRIEPRIGAEGIYLELQANDNRATTVFPPKDAPALALGILEAAGVDLNESWNGLDPYGTPSHLGWIGGHLRAYMRQFAKATAEAEAQAELEAEALEFINAARASRGSDPLSSFDQLSDGGKREYLSIASRAREMRNEKKVTTDD